MSTTVELVAESPGVARVVFRSDTGVQILSRDVCNALRKIVASLKSSPTVRVVVFEARGRTFLAGADLRELRDLTRKTALRYARDGQDLFARIARLRAMTIAAIHAPCVGGGCEMALACDLRLAASSARIGLPEVTLGIVPGWGGTVRATRLLGAAGARRLILSGELLDAEAALRLGLVDAVIEDDRFRDVVDARMAQLLKTAPDAAARAGRLIERIDPTGTRRLFEREAREFAACYATDEPFEGIQAFIDKRPPRWSQ
jgi:enoyl-CoA hydratase